jgi:hypothetical protein
MENSHLALGLGVLATRLPFLVPGGWLSSVVSAVLVPAGWLLPVVFALLVPAGWLAGWLLAAVLFLDDGKFSLLNF